MKIFKEKKEYRPQDYNIKEIRKNNVTSKVQNWYDFLLDSGVDLPDDIDPMLYAIELAYREHNRYDHKFLPKLDGNMFAGYRYGSLLPPYKSPNPEWVDKKKKDAMEMITYLISKGIRKSTVLKWQKPEN